MRLSGFDVLRAIGVLAFRGRSDIALNQRIAKHGTIYTEVFLVSSWIDHLRLRERTTIADEEIRHRVRSFHLGAEPPAVRRLIGERVRGFSPV